jgi:hypothetical protein
MDSCPDGQLCARGIGGKPLSLKGTAGIPTDPVVSESDFVRALNEATDRSENGLSVRM